MRNIDDVTEEEAADGGLAEEALDRGQLVDVGRRGMVAIGRGYEPVYGYARARLGAVCREVGVARVRASQGATGRHRRGRAPDRWRGRRRVVSVHVGRRALHGGCRRCDGVLARVQFTLGEVEQGAEVIRGWRRNGRLGSGAGQGDPGARR